MAFSVSTITDYVNPNEKQLLGEAVLKGKTISLINTQVGVKGSAYLNLLSASPTLQAGACGWNAAGTTTVTRRKIETGQMKVNEPFCDKDLVDTFMSYGVKVAAGAKTLPFEQDFIDQNLKAVQKDLEMQVWQGDATGSTGYTLMDGFIKILEAEATVVDATHTSPKSLTTDAKACIDAIVAAIPNEIIDQDNLVIFAGYEVVKAYIKAIQDANLYHYTVELNSSLETIIPGTSIKLIGVAGLNNTKKAYASYLNNFTFGTDMMGDSEKFEFWYSQDNSEYRLKVEFNAGVQVAFPKFVTKYLGA